jgi:arylsulfatase
VPAIAWYPSMIESGARTDEFATVMDILPTFLELAETEHPGSEYRGRAVEPVRGRSLVTLLSGGLAPESPGSTGWELLHHRGVRHGDWKLVWDQTQGAEARWQLFNLTPDPGELLDLRDAEPARFEAMLAEWDQYSRANGVVIVR